MARLEPLPGTTDIWLPETDQWFFLEDTARRVFSLYGYGELRTPIIERTEVFERGIGTDTEVVQKEMYTFPDRGGRSLTLRPEGTAGIMRAIANQGIMPGEEKRVFYFGPMFRGERPAAGRKRQFHQIGVEAAGKSAPAVDAECIAMLIHYLKEIGLNQIRLLINSRGTTEDRKKAASTLQDFFHPHLAQMCDDCRRRIDTNVWRILDCKNERCRETTSQAPPIIELLSRDSQFYFRRVQDILQACGIEYETAPHLVRGLDYYQHTVFEVISENRNLGAQNAIAGGGRYEITLPGLRKSIPGVGFALGMERLIMALGFKEEREISSIGYVDVFVAALGANALAPALEISQILRQNGIKVLCESEGRSMKAQMRTADKSGAAIALIIGEEELTEGQVTVKNMRESCQEKIARSQTTDFILKSLNRLPGSEK